jgi:hypothetical protein
LGFIQSISQQSSRSGTKRCSATSSRQAKNWRIRKQQTITRGQLPLLQYEYEHEETAVSRQQQTPRALDQLSGMFHDSVKDIQVTKSFKVLRVRSTYEENQARPTLGEKAWSKTLDAPHFYSARAGNKLRWRRDADDFK